MSLLLSFSPSLLLSCLRTAVRIPFLFPICPLPFHLSLTERALLQTVLCHHLHAVLSSPSCCWRHSSVWAPEVFSLCDSLPPSLPLSLSPFLRPLPSDWVKAPLFFPVCFLPFHLSFTEGGLLQTVFVITFMLLAPLFGMGAKSALPFSPSRKRPFSLYPSLPTSFTPALLSSDGREDLSLSYLSSPLSPELHGGRAATDSLCHHIHGPSLRCV